MKYFIIITLFLYIIIHIQSNDYEYSWNLKNKKEENIFLLKNIDINHINKTLFSYSISKAIYEKDEHTDLYLSFDEKLKEINIDNYNIIYNKYHSSSNRAIFNKSGYFIGENERLELVGNKSSFFQSGINLTSFTISFWIYPVSFSNNEIVLRIGSQHFNNLINTVEDQSIYAKIIDGKLNWKFKNIFSSKNIRKNEIVLESHNRLIPEKWSHINLSYDVYSGIIRENINGVEEGLIVASEDGSLNSTLLNLKYNKTNRCIISIAPTFYGAIDEFCIYKENKLNKHNLYKNENGEIISKVKDFGQGGVFINNISIIEEKKNNSEIYFYYRYSDYPFDHNEENSKGIKWIFFNYNKFNILKARYFQWKAILLAGDNNNFSPELREIKIFYEKDTHPSKPKGLQVLFKNDKIYLKWKIGLENDLKGYKIYYGLKSGKYFGIDSDQGKSPIDIGLMNQFEITGLKNNKKIYYFSITAYDDDNHRHESEFSQEVSIRPYFY